MWFKNLVIYRFETPTTISAEELEEKLATIPYRPCGKIETVTYGWTPPIPEGSAFVHASNRCLLFSMCQEERLLPASVINEVVEQKVNAMEMESSRKIYRKEKLRIKEETTLDLLPKAFTRKKILHAYIDIKNQLLIINAASFSMAEKLTHLLRKSLGSLPIIFLETQESPSIIMTKWLDHSHPLPSTITLGDECELEAPEEEGGIIRCKRLALTSEEILQHLSSGKLVNKIGIEWKDAISCILQKDFCIKRLRFSDQLKAQSGDFDASEAALQFDADFTLMVLTIREFMQEITFAFGDLVSTNNSEFTPVKQTEIKSEEAVSDTYVS